jgi:hypothetical protein
LAPEIREATTAGCGLAARTSILLNHSCDFAGDGTRLAQRFVHRFPPAPNGALSLLGVLFCSRADVLSGVLKSIAGVVDPTLDLFAGSISRLWSIE